jgi:peptidoglycan/xylan/chitin deacetylase (PgdA/CDA1 family)
VAERGLLVSVKTDVVVAIAGVATLALTMVGCATGTTATIGGTSPATSASAAASSASASPGPASSASASPASASASPSSTSPSPKPASASASSTKVKAGKAVTQPPLGTPVDCTKVACVALTFDDGPGAYVSTLLKTLTDADVPATFFFLSSVAANNKAGAAAVAANPYMVIGDHSITHPQLPTLGLAAMTKEIAVSRQRLEAQTGRTITLFRPPYGAMNAQVKKLCAANGMAIITWSVDTLDWKYRSAAKLAPVAMSEVHPGAIVLMHDIHKTTVQGVPDLIASLNKAGYTLVTVPTLLGTTTPGKVYSQRHTG